MTFDVDIPIDTVFNDVEKLGDIATADLNPFTNQQYRNLACNILEKIGQYKISLCEWNQKDTAKNTWSAFKPKF